MFTKWILLMRISSVALGFGLAFSTTCVLAQSNNIGKLSVTLPSVKSESVKIEDRCSENCQGGRPNSEVAGGPKVRTICEDSDGRRFEAQNGACIFKPAKVTMSIAVDATVVEDHKK